MVTRDVDWRQNNRLQLITSGGRWWGLLYKIWNLPLNDRQKQNKVHFMYIFGSSHFSTWRIPKGHLQMLFLGEKREEKLRREGADPREAIIWAVSWGTNVASRETPVLLRTTPLVLNPALVLERSRVLECYSTQNKKLDQVREGDKKGFLISNLQHYIWDESIN